MVKNARLLVLVVLLLASAIAIGQAISGDLVGTVLDKSGAVIPNATVTVLNTATNIKTTVKTNTQGEYRFTNLPIGTYDLTITAEGFGAKTLRNALVELNKTATFNVTMELGKVATTVEVTDAAPAIDTTTAQVQTTYQISQAADMPAASVGLGVLNLSMLQAGVGSSGGVGAGAGPSVGGQRPRNNNFTIEGVDNNDKGVTGPLVNVPNDAVANFTVMQNQFSPEFGHSTGGQFNTVVQSGSNSFHGKAYEYFQNRNLNAIDTLSGTNPRYDNNRFGGNVGGPIVKNKLFFFVNYEYQPIGQATVAPDLYVPTAQGYQTLATILGVNVNNITGYRNSVVAAAATPDCNVDSQRVGAGGFGTTLTGGYFLAGANLQSALANELDPGAKGTQANPYGVAGGGPWGGVAPVQIPCGKYPFAAPNFTNNRALVTAVDANLSERDQIRGRYIFNKSAFTDTAGFPASYFQSIAQPYHLFTLGEYHTFSPAVMNEFRVGYTRTKYNYGVPSNVFQGQDMFPNISIDETSITLGPDSNAPQWAVQNTYQAVDNVSVTKSNHTIKFGAEFRKYLSPQKFIQRARGDYYWDSWSAFAWDLTPYFAERSVGDVGYDGSNPAFYWYINDNWKVRPNFSINLGLRHEWTGIPVGWKDQALNRLADAPGVITFGAPKAPRANFMPRIGFAYSPGSSGNTSIRGGFGMGYDVLYDNIGTLARPPQISVTIDCPGDDPKCPTDSAAVTALAGTYRDFAGLGGQFMKVRGILPGLPDLSTPAAAKHYTSSYLPVDVKYPYSIQWNLGVQHVFASNYTFEMRYVGTRGVHLNVQNRLNIKSIVNPANYLPTFMSRPSQATLDAMTTTLSGLEAQSNYVPAFASAGFDGSPVVGFMPFGGSIYHGLATQLNRRFSNGLQFQAAWTWSHTIDDSTADFFSTVLTPRRPQDFQNLHAERSNSALDRAHRITLTALYDLPILQHSNSRFLKDVIGNWTIAPVYTFETGEWATVQSARDVNLNGDSAGDRAIYNPNGIPGTSTSVTALKTTVVTHPDGTTSGGETVAYLVNDPNAMWIRGGSGALMNSTRNSYQMHGISNIDLTLKKTVTVTERYKLEFAAQALNALNHPQWIGGSLNTINSIGQTGGAAKNYLTPGNSIFGRANKAFSSNPRSMQLYLKFIF